ncbi:uncharacterized protein [Parasteatoda tepidariorum]|uniref:uncharacterized protein n=1 Tax=Parasteatoda tepidariorum TaxID=114398 RepID=UPI0039BCA0F4
MEKLPIEWEGGSICLLFKKSDSFECRNYRGITLLNTAYKIRSNILFIRLQPFAAKVVGNYQYGFRPQRSTIDQRQILGEKTKYSIKTFHLFIDIKVAYDSIKREELLEAINEFDIPAKLVTLTSVAINNLTNQGHFNITKRASSFTARVDIGTLGRISRHTFSLVQSSFLMKKQSCCKEKQYHAEFIAEKPLSTAAILPDKENINSTMRSMLLYFEIRGSFWKLKRRWRWLGNILRTDRNNPANVASSWVPDGRRKRGRPRLTWQRCIKEDLSRAGLTEWEVAH